MGILNQWRIWRNAAKFSKLGAGCDITAGPLEIKGRVELGAHCVVRGNCVLRTHKEGKILIGDRVELSDYAMLASDISIEIGDDTYVGPHCVLRDINHSFHGTEEHWRLTPHILKPIVVGSKCYLGARSYIMPGVTIGEGAVVAPGSIVTRDIGPYEVWAGAPSAQFIAHRTDPEKMPSRKRHLELLQLFGFEGGVEGAEVVAPDSADAAPPALEPAPPEPEPEPKKSEAQPAPAKKKARPKATIKKNSAVAKKKAPAKKKAAATKKPAAKKPAAKPTAKKASAKKPAAKKSSAKKGGGAKGENVETPAAVKKALSDASSVLKALDLD